MSDREKLTQALEERDRLSELVETFKSVRTARCPTCGARVYPGECWFCDPSDDSSDRDTPRESPTARSVDGAAAS